MAAAPAYVAVLERNRIDSVTLVLHGNSEPVTPFVSTYLCFSKKRAVFYHRALSEGKFTPHYFQLRKQVVDEIFDCISRMFITKRTPIYAYYKKRNDVMNYGEFAEMKVKIYAGNRVREQSVGFKSLFTLTHDIVGNTEIQLSKSMRMFSQLFFLYACSREWKGRACVLSPLFG